MKKNILSLVSVFVLALLAMNCDTDIKTEDNDTEEIQSTNTGTLKLINQQIYNYDGELFTESGTIRAFFSYPEEIPFEAAIVNGIFSIEIPEPDEETLEAAAMPLLHLFNLSKEEMPDTFPEDKVFAFLSLVISNQNKEISRVVGSIHDFDVGDSFTLEFIIYSNCAVQIPEFTMDDFNEVRIVQNMELKKGWNRVLLTMYIDIIENTLIEYTIFSIDPDFDGKWTVVGF